MYTHKEILKGHRAFFNVDTGKYEAEKISNACMSFPYRQVVCRL